MSTKKHLTPTEAQRLSEAFPQWGPWAEERGWQVGDLCADNDGSQSRVAEIDPDDTGIDGAIAVQGSEWWTPRWYTHPALRFHLLPDLDDLLEFAYQCAGSAYTGISNSGYKWTAALRYSTEVRDYNASGYSGTRIDAVYAALMAMARGEGFEETEGVG